MFCTFNLAGEADCGAKKVARVAARAKKMARVPIAEAKKMARVSVHKLLRKDQRPESR